MGVVARWLRLKALASAEREVAELKRRVAELEMEKRYVERELEIVALQNEAQRGYLEFLIGLGARCGRIVGLPPPAPRLEAVNGRVNR